MDDNVPQKSVEYLGMQNSGCLPEGLQKTAFNEPSVYKWDYSNGILNLGIYHSSNCCPEFHDSVAVNGRQIEMYLRDDLGNCLCICEYHTDYSFQLTELGEYRILFYFKYKAQAHYSALIDTVLQIN